MPILYYNNDMPIDALFLGGTSIDLIQNREKGRGKAKFSSSVGGSITNSAIIAAKLGVKAGLLSRIGQDPFGNFARYYLRMSKIDTEGMMQDPNIHTPIAMAKINKSGIAKYKFYKNSPKDSVVPIKTTPKYLLNT